jgi:hypothetical protein
MSTARQITALPRHEPKRFFSEGLRGYETPIGLSFGITTVLDNSRDNSDILIWRESVGEARADEISALARYRGTKHHENIELYLQDSKEPAFCYFNTPYWKSVYPFLQKIEKPLLLEGAVWHPDGYAGTLDCIAYLKGDGEQPTLLDWKTADSVRKPNKIYEYSLQCAAYVAAANYVYADLGLNIQKAKIVVAIPDTEPQIETLDLDALKQYYSHFLARLQRFTYFRK